MRPIDADALIEKCGDWYVEEGTESGFIGTLKNLLSTMPTVQHEKAQLSKEDITSDLISRQAVLDAIVQCTNCGDEDTLREYVLKHSLDNGWTGGILEALDAVKDLPTVQPELTDEQAIAHLQSSGWMQRHDKEMYESGLREQLADDSNSYDSLLPPIQPEPKEGKWEQASAQRYFTSASYIYRCSVCGENNPRNTKYCPNCGARMKGERQK